MVKMFRKFTVSLSIALAIPLMALAPLAGAATSTVIVTGNTAAGENQPGWLFNRDTSTSTAYNFTTAQHSIGVGSLQVDPISSNPSDKFVAENFLKVPVTSMNSVSYHYLIAGNGTAASANQFYMNIYATTDNSNKFYDCRFDYVPANGSISNFMTASFAATDTPVNVRTTTNNPRTICPTTLAGMPPGSYVRAFALNVGDTSASDAGLAGYLDNVVVNVGSDVTIYDFEPVLAPASKDSCKNSGWTTFNTPTFKNQGDCVSYTARTKITNTTLNSNDMSGIDVPTKKGNMYRVTVAGTWNNTGRSGEVVDAECTSWQNNGPWTNAVNGFTPDLLDVQINKEFVDWGECNSAAHEYTRWVEGTGSPLNLRVFDGDTSTGTQNPGWYNDNDGTFEVAVVSYPKN